MQHAVAINTLSFAKKLRNAGFNDEQAEIQAEAINDVLIDFQDKRLEKLATKGDLKAAIADVRADVNRVENELKSEIGRVENGLKAEIGRVENGLKAEIANVRTEIAKTSSNMIKWGIGLVIAQFAAFVTVIKFLK